MCSICNAENKVTLDKDFFPTEEINTFIEKVFSGEINIHSLDIAQYLKMSERMIESVKKGFGKERTDKDSKLLKDFTDNAYMFCAAKQYQLVRQILDLINETLPTKQDYYLKAVEIFKKFNHEYFEAELDSAEHQAKAGKQYINNINWLNSGED